MPVNFFRWICIFLMYFKMYSHFLNIIFLLRCSLELEYNYLYKYHNWSDFDKIKIYDIYFD